MAIVPEDTYQPEDQTPVKMDTSEPAVDMSQPEPDPLFSYSEAELQKLNAFQIEQQNVTPEAAKTALDQESNMGMPVDFNDKATGTFSDLGKISVQSIQKDAPRFTSWLAENKNHLPLIADDVQTMKDMEFGIDELSTLDKLYNTTGSAFSGFNAMVAKTPAFLFNVAAAPQNFVADALNIPSLKANADLENSVSKYFTEQQKVFADKVPELSMSMLAELSNGNFAKAGRITLYQALQSAPTTLALGTAAISGIMARRVGLGLAGAMAGADKSQEYIESGMSNAKASILAIPSAVYETAFESLAIGKITQGFAQQITKAMGSQTAKEWAKAVSKGLAYSFAQEASEEAMTSIANDLTDNIIGVSNYSFGEIASRAIDAGAVGGVAGGAGVGVPIAMSGVYRSQAMRQAQLQKDFYTALQEKSERSALKARLPEKFQEAVASMTKDGPVENIYVNAEALQSYFQSKGEGKLAEFLNSVDANESFDSALESGGLVKIPTAVWATKVAGTDVHKGMADDITFDPNKFTNNEAKQVEDVSPETMKLAQEKLSSQDLSGSTPAQIQKMMEEVGVPKAVARQASQVWRHIDVLQTRTPNAKKLFDQIKLTFNRNGLTSTKPAVQPESTEPRPINQAINGPIEGYAYKKEAIENLNAAVLAIETDTSKLVGFAQQGDRAGSENIQRLAGYTVGEPFIMQVRNKYDRLDKKEIQKIVKKALDGKKLTVGQQAIFDDLYRASGYDKEYSSNSQDIPKTEEDFMLQGGQQLFQGAQQNDLGFYSKLVQTISDKMGTTATKAQVEGMIKEIKPEERKWLGIDEFLKGKEKINKAELIAFLEANDLQIQEITKGQNVNRNLTVKEGPEGSPFRYAVADENGKVLKSFKTKLEAEDYALLGEIGGDTKFGQYVLPNGTNYREVLFTLPQKYIEPELNKISDTEWELGGFSIKDTNGANYEITKGGSVYARRNSFGAALDWVKADLEKINDQQYRSSHFDEANILAHVRLNDRTDAEGKRVLFVEEIQSDWHQAGRKRGYKEGDENALRKERGLIEDQLEEQSRLGEDKDIDLYQKLNNRRREITDQITAIQTGVPDAPFKKTWHEFALKRIIRMASEQGYDKIAWTTGEQQAERYDLSKQIGEITVGRNSSGNYDVIAFKDKPSERRGRNPVVDKSGITEDELESVIGKDLAQKAINDTSSGKTISYSGLDLKVGGEGMKGFYDKILVDAANKLGKKFGAKVVDGKIRQENAYYVSQDTEDAWGVYKRQGNSALGELVDGGYKLKRDALLSFKKFDAESASVIHELEITPALKGAAINEGFSLFQGNEDAKGKITFDRAQKIFDINWLKNADLTTFLHESAHMFLEINTYLANDPETSQAVKDDYKKILDYVGLKEGEQLKTKHHEKFAEAFEKYLMTGKAPTVELRQAFATIKSWFISIYHSIKNLYPNVELNEEITGVFDRMLATDAELERAKEDIAADPMIKEAISVMKPDEATRYLKAIESERKSAEELIYAEALKEYTREERAKRKARKVEIQAQVEAELKPQYIVYDALTDGITMQDGSTVKMKLDRKEVEDVYGADIAAKIPASVYGSNASGLDIVASTLVDPFASGSTVVKILSEQMPKQKAIKREVNARLDAEFGDPVADGTIGDLADAAVHNVDGAKRRLIELDFLIQNNPKEFKRQAGIMARRRLVTEAQFRRRAEITLGTMNLKEIKPSQFKRAEAKNGNEAFKAFQAGDYEAAIDFKQKELLNFELHRLSIMANDEVQKGLNKFNKFFASDEKIAKRRSIEYVNAGRAILAKFGLGESERTPESYLEQIKKYDEEGYAVAKAQYDAIEIPSKDYLQLSFNEFISVKDSVDALWDLSRADNQITIDGKMISKAEALTEIMADYDKMSPVKSRKELGELTKKEKIEAAFLSAKQALVRIESWADYMGPSFKKYIYDPISSAATNYRIARKDYANRVKKMVDDYAKTVDFDKAIATELKGMDGTFKNKYELIGALLHTGNASNYKKLLLGNKWGTRNEDGSLNDEAFKSQLAKYFMNGTITKTDMDFVQSIWDLLEEMKPAAQKAHKAMYGYYFSEITANEIVTPFGTYKGGYYPAVIDRNRTSSAAQEKKVFDASAELQSQSQMFPQTNNGFTKNRVENFSDKLQMNLMLAASHIDRVLKFTHMSPAVKDVQKILMSRDFKARLRNDDPEFFGNALLPWIQRSSLQMVSTTPNSLLEKIMAGARTRAAALIMLLNVGNTLQQYTGIVIGLSKVKAKYIRKSMGSLLTKKTELYESIQKLSPFMVTRMDSQMETMNQAIDKILDPKNKFEQIREFAVQNTYVLQSAAQNQVDAIVWMGAYNQALDKGMTSAQAVKDADSTVRLTQGSFSPEDVAKFEAGSPALRMFTLFGGYWNMILNLAGTEGMKTLKESGLKAGAGRLSYLYMTIFLVPAVLSGIIARAMWGAPFDEDDDGDIADDLLFNAMGDQFKTILSLVPIAGPTAISAYNRLFTENPFDDRLNLSPVLVALESVAGFPKAAYKLAVEDEIKRKDVKDVLTAVSMFTGVPVTPIAKPINYLLDVDSGKANPENPVDFTRGLISGSAGGKQ
jgi:hypothetical protein